MELRVVFEHCRGPYPGLRQIMGVVSQLSPDGKTPGSAEHFHVLGRQVDFASLVQVRRTCAVYRELRRDDANRYFPPRV